MATQQPPSRLIPGRPPRYPAGTTFNLATGQEDALDRAIRADPQALELLRQKPGGVYLDANDLRSIGYDVPDNATFVVPYRMAGGPEQKIQRGQIDDKFASLGEKIVTGAGMGMLGYGAAAAIAGPAAVAGGPASTAAPATGTAAPAAGAAAPAASAAAPAAASTSTAATTGGFVPTVVAPSAATAATPAFTSGVTAALPGFAPSASTLALMGGAAAAPSIASQLGTGATGLSNDPDVTGYQPPSSASPTSTPPFDAAPNIASPEGMANAQSVAQPSTASGNPYKDFLDKYGEDIGKTVEGLGKGAGDERDSENIFNRSRDSVLAQIARDQALFDLQNAQSTFDRNLQGAESLYDRNRQQQKDIFGAGMDTATFGRENQSREMRQAMLSGLIGGAQDFKVTGMNPKIAERMPTSTGGARPSMFAGSRDSILATLGRPQVQAPTYTPPPGFAAPAPYAAPGGYKPPTLTEYERAGKLETGLNVGGLIGKLKPWKWF